MKKQEIESKILDKIEQRLLSYNNFNNEDKEKKEDVFKFKSEKKWKFQDGYIEEATKFYRITSLNLNNVPISIFGYCYKDNILKL
jgi:hypothetical protein